MVIKKLSIFIFRRDLRITDNIGLINALKESVVIPIFIFTPEQIRKNKYMSMNAIQFMMESLAELELDIKKHGGKLFYFFGKQHEIVATLVKKYNISDVFINKDYTKYAIERDAKIENICRIKKVNFHAYDDYSLHKIGTIMTGTGTPYMKFTPFYDVVKTVKVPIPQKVSKFNFYKGIIHGSIKMPKYKENPDINVHGGRINAVKILKNIQEFNSYDKYRDFLAYETTSLSAYIKFGCVSIREVYYYFKKLKHKLLIKQLYWRDFYYQISFHFPEIYSGAMKQQYNKIKWENDMTLFKKWKNGTTGFPIVDAGMRQLNKTGYMHNRTRMVTSNFLVKVLHINWRLGERYFATKLVDYDPMNNNGGWQWSASTGTDSQPYFRIFNPWLQSIKHDENCVYIKKWVPELKDVKCDDIHKWYDTHNQYDINYPKPAVDFKERARTTLKMYVNASK